MTGHPADGMDEVSAIEIFEPVLIRVMGVGPTMEVSGRRVLNPVLIMSVLGNKISSHDTEPGWLLIRYPSSLNIKGVMAQLVLVWLPV